VLPWAKAAVAAAGVWCPSVLLCVVALGVFSDVVRRFFFLPKKSFADRHVLVTGGSQGIGRSLAAQLLRRGARVTILARTEAKLRTATDELRAAEIERRGGGASDASKAVLLQYVCASTTDSAQLNAAVEEASKKFGPVDCLIACAGGALPGLFLHTPADEYAKAMDLNYMGTLRSIKAVVEGMVARKKGQIIVVGSALSVVAFMGYSTYASTKHALRGLADTLRNELVGFGITVHIAYPPDTQVMNSSTSLSE
jgi:3-dehydrosphinganine reductase